MAKISDVIIPSCTAFFFTLMIIITEQYECVLDICTRFIFIFITGFIFFSDTHRCRGAGLAAEFMISSRMRFSETASDVGRNLVEEKTEESDEDSLVHFS